MNLTIPLKICQFLVSSSLLQTALNAKHWKSASFSSLPHFILLDLTNNLITYSSFLIALHFFSILALFFIIFILFCKLMLTYTFYPCCVTTILLHSNSICRIYSSFTTLVLLIFLHLITGSARNVVLKTTLLKVRFILMLYVNVKDYIVQHAQNKIVLCKMSGCFKPALSIISRNVKIK